MRILIYISSTLVAIALAVLAMYTHTVFNLNNPKIVTTEIRPIEVPADLPVFIATTTEPSSLEENEVATSSETVEQILEDEVQPTTEPEVVIESTPAETKAPEVQPEPLEVDGIEFFVEEVVPEPDEFSLSLEEELSFSDINLATRESLVNILCLTRDYHNYLAPISGSGIIIDERGVILTNAHIAQYFLLKDFPTEGFVNCLIRTGSPAKATYKASLLHISPNWIDENTKAIATENPKGTGEFDFAFLLIDEALNGNTLPDSFPYIEVDANEQNIKKDMDLLIAAYPAGFLGVSTIHKSLYAASAITTAQELYRFNEEDVIDVISLGGTVVAQQGSSGGGVVTKAKKLIGIISTSSSGETTSDRDLRAITVAHIERSLVANNNTTIEQLLSGDIRVKAAAFNAGAAATLLQILKTALVE